MPLPSLPLALLFTIVLVACTYTATRLWQQNNVIALDGLEALFLGFLTTIILMGWLGTLLATIGQFQLLGVLILTLPVAPILWAINGSQPLTPMSPLQWQEWSLVLILIVAALLYFQPHEPITGGADAGSYINTAASLAQTGQFIVVDEWGQLLHDHADITLRQQPPTRRTTYLQFVGWYVDDNDPTRSIPQFFPFHIVWLAIVTSVGGIWAALYLTPFWGVLGLTAVYLTGRRLFDRNIALLATALLAITPTHLYFARYPTTEPLTLLLIFTAILTFHTLWQHPKAPLIWGVVGGASIGAAMLTRIDLPVVGLIIVGLLFIRWRQRQWSRGWSAYTITFTLFLLHTAVTAFWLNWPYTWNTYSAVFQTLFRTWWLFGLLLTLGLGSLILITWQWQQLLTYGDRLITQLGPQRLRWLAALSVIGLSSYAYWLRPFFAPPITYLNWLGSEVPLIDGLNWIRIGWYITPLGLLLATLGFAWLLQRVSWYQYSFFLAVTFLTTVQYVYRSFIPPYHIYMMRRYVPIILPALILMMAYFILQLAQNNPKRLTKPISLLLALFLAGGLLLQSINLLPQQDGKGLVTQLTQLNDALDPNAILIINDPTSSLFADAVGVPLKHLFNHPIATIRDETADLTPLLTQTAVYAAEQNRPIQLLAINPIADNVRQALTLQPNTMVPLQWEALQSSFDQLPTQNQTTYYAVEIYDVTINNNDSDDSIDDDNNKQPPSSNRGVSSLNVVEPTVQTIDIGTLDSAYLDDGFYYKEPLPGPITMRWTNDEATLFIPWSAPTPVTIDVQAMIFRPDGVPTTAVYVWLDDQNVGQFTPTNQWQTFSFEAMAQPSNNNSIVTFTTETFNPATLQISNDDRELGFLLDWVKITNLSN